MYKSDLTGGDNKSDFLRKDERARLTSTVTELERFLGDSTVKERLEIDTLGKFGILKQTKKFITTQIKLKTKLFYKQQMVLRQAGDRAQPGPCHRQHCLRHPAHQVAHQLLQP